MRVNESDGVAFLLFARERPGTIGGDRCGLTIPVTDAPRGPSAISHVTDERPALFDDGHAQVSPSRSA